MPLKQSQTYAVQDFAETFGKLRIPVHVFEYDIDGYTFDNVIVHYRFSPDEVLYDETLEPVGVRFTNGLSRRRDLLVEEKRRETMAKEQRFFNGPQVGLRDFSTEEKSHYSKKLVLDTRPSFFFDYAAIQLILDKPVLKDGKTIRDEYKINPYSWNNVDELGYIVLPNNIGSEWVVISEPDHKLIASQRSEKLVQYPGLYGVSPAGFMMRKILTKEKKLVPADVIDGIPNPFKTAMREGQEEMGLEFKLDQIKIYALARPWDDLHAELIGEIRTPLTVNEILSGIPKGSKYENVRLIDVPFDQPGPVIKGYPEKNYPGLVGYKDFDFTHPTGPWVPAQALAVIYSAIREHGEEKVKKVISEL
jgi:hypothetical protein